MAIYFISPIAYALNTHSIDLEAGGNQYLSIVDGSQTGLDGSSNMTVEAWVKFESLPVFGADGFSIISKAVSSGDNRSYNLYFSSTDAKLHWASHSDGLNGIDVGVDWSPSTETWYHIAVSKADMAIIFYVNGVQQGSAQIGTSTIFNSSAPFRIGAHGNGESYFDGVIDEVRVWNIARTASEISTNKSVELNGNEAGLVGYWKLNNSLDDLTSNGNDLTNNNAAAFSTDPSFSEPPAPPQPQTATKVRKPTNESVSNLSVLQNDDALVLSLAAHKTYIVEGVIFASAGKAIPDLRLAFAAPDGSDMAIGYLTDAILQNGGGVLNTSGASSRRIQIPASTSIPIIIRGTIVAGSTGDLQLKWAQFTSNGNAVTILKGSYLKIEEI